MPRVIHHNFFPFRRLWRHQLIHTYTPWTTTYCCKHLLLSGKESHQAIGVPHIRLTPTSIPWGRREGQTTPNGTTSKKGPIKYRRFGIGVGSLPAANAVQMCKWSGPSVRNPGLAAEIFHICARVRRDAMPGSRASVLWSVLVYRSERAPWSLYAADKKEHDPFDLLCIYIPPSSRLSSTIEHHLTTGPALCPNS